MSSQKMYALLASRRSMTSFLCQSVPISLNRMRGTVDSALAIHWAADQVAVSRSNVAP